MLYQDLNIKNKMNFRKFIYSVSPYFYKNHLFVSDIKANLLHKKIPVNYIIQFPVDTSVVSKDDLVYIDFNVEDFNKNIKSNNELLLVFWKNKIVHRSIIQTQGKVSMEGDRNAFHLKENEIYIHSCYTSEEHRGNGLYSSVLNYILNIYMNKEIPKKVFIACRQKNLVSVKGITKAGFIYNKSSKIIGFLSGRIRFRKWYYKNIKS